MKIIKWIAKALVVFFARFLPIIILAGIGILGDAADKASDWIDRHVPGYEKKDAPRWLKRLLKFDD